MEVPLYTFKSGEEEHNAIEQVAYIQDTAERVLTVVNWATAWRNTSDRSAAS